MKILDYGKAPWKEVELWKIIDETPLSVYYFIRCDETTYSISARLPPELATLEAPVWMSLIKPHTSDNTSCSW
jgi:hypothetical protein